MEGSRKVLQILIPVISTVFSGHNKVTQLHSIFSSIDGWYGERLGWVNTEPPFVKLILVTLRQGNMKYKYEDTADEMSYELQFTVEYRIPTVIFGLLLESVLQYCIFGNQP